MAEQNPFNNDRLMGAISYLGILFFLPLFTSARKSAFVRFHVRQGMVLFAVEAVAGLVPILGWAVVMICVVASVIGAVAALQGREWEVPVLGKYAKMIEL